MKKATRKIVFLLFLALFLVSAPTVVMYTAGYRLNLERFSLVKTGVFALSTLPKGATVIIDGKSTEKETTLILKDAMPGEHLIRLEKENYLPWTKKLEVKENETTFVQKAILFLVGEPILKVAEKYLAFSFDSRGEKIAFALQEEGWVEIWSRTLASNEEKLLLRLPQNDLDKIGLSWLVDDKTLLVKKTSGLSETQQTIDQNGNSKILENKLSEWQRDANQLLYISPTETGTNLVLKKSSDAEQTLASLPTGNYEFLSAPPSLVLLQDKAQRKIILIDDRGVDQPILLNTEAIIAVWNPQNAKQLLYISDFEVHIFDAEKMTDELLTRVSTPIISTAWQPTAADIFYADNKNLYALELDRRGAGRNIFTLATMDNIEAFVPTSDGKILYLVGTRGSEVGLFERALME
ncbi:MAG: PEGA domain-containing protein [Candidatus Uhrbacteria bacterium]